MAAQRYETIAKETDIYYSSKCPVVLCAYAVLLDSKMKKYVAQLKLRNCGSEVISSVSVVVRAYDHFDEVAEEINGYQYVGVNVKQGEEFGTKSLIPLSKKVKIKRLEVAVNKIVFSNGSTWDSENGELLDNRLEPQDLASIYSDKDIENYRFMLNSKMKYVPYQKGMLWICSCGEINYGGESCYSCGVDKAKVFDYIIKERLNSALLDPKYNNGIELKKQQSIESLKAAITIFEELGDYKDSKEQISSCKQEIDSIQKEIEAKKQEEERQAELQRKEADEKAKKNKRVAIIAAAIAIVCIAGFLIVTKVITPNNNYNAAVKLMENGDYDGAIAAFESLGDYRDSEEKIKECKYQEANALMENGSYAEALAIYTEIKDFSDSETKIEECKAKSKEQDYNNAIALMNSGDYEKAIKAFEALEGYKDSNDKITECENEIKYQEAISLLSYEDPDYENNAKAKTILEELGDYKDAKDYLSQIYLVLTSDSSHYLKYDEYGHVVSNYDSAVTQEYDDDGRIVKLTIEGDTPLETNYTYDDDGQIIRIESGDRVYTREYEYNSEGQVSKRVQTSPDGKVTPAVYEYTTEGDYTVVTMKEDVPVNTYTILRTYKMYFYNGEYLTRIEYSASKTRKTYEFSYNYIWAPKHDQNEEFYHELYLMQEYF